MIIEATQVTNFTQQLTLNNKIQNVNAELYKTVLASLTDDTTHTESFSNPPSGYISINDAGGYYNNNEYVYGLNQYKTFDFSKEFKFSKQVTKVSLQVAYTGKVINLDMKGSLANPLYLTIKNWPSGITLIRNGKEGTSDTNYKNVKDEGATEVSSSSKITMSTHKVWSGLNAGALRACWNTMYNNVNGANVKDFSFTQIDYYTIAVTGRVLTYLCAAIQRGMDRAYEEKWLDSFKITLTATHADETQTVYTYNNKVPSYQLVTNKLLQADATNNSKPLIDSLATSIVSKYDEGRLLISFDLLSEANIVTLLDEFKFRDKFGKLLKNGSNFCVYAITNKQHISNIKTIYAIEVK